MTHAAKLFKSHGALIGIAILAYFLLIWAPGSLSAFRLENLGLIAVTHDPPRDLANA